jgi:hypothetical protein
MLLRSRTIRAYLSFEADGEDSGIALCFDCRPTKSNGVLDIGEKYIFGATQIGIILGKRRSCKLQVELRRKSSLTQELIQAFNLATSKIGALTFHPPSKQLDFFPASPAFLDAHLYVGDEYFDRLLSALQAGKRVMGIDLEIEKPGFLEYGREPDGSRIVWKLENTTEPSTVHVESMNIGIELFEPNWFRRTARDYM